MPPKASKKLTNKALDCNPTPLMTKAQVAELFTIFKKNKPAPQGELLYCNPYTLLVAVVLSAQATDLGVNKATKKLFSCVQDPWQMVVLGEEGLKEHIKTIGLFNAKAKNIIKLSHMLINHHQGQVPCNREELEKLPGVGRKTANVVLNVCFNQDTIAVDTHVFRVANRLGLAPGKTPLEVELGLLRVIPKEFLRDAHHWLILHGRYICKSQSPLCSLCPVQHLCQWALKNKI